MGRTPVTERTTPTWTDFFTETFVSALKTGAADFSLSMWSTDMRTTMTRKTIKIPWLQNLAERRS